jgi:surfactin synthase thioesterase subunit
MNSPLPLPGPPHRSPGTLFCLPHAGGSALVYRHWQALLPAGVRVVPLELPGHGSRLREPLLDSAPALAEDLAASVRAAGPGRYAIFGHSLGAVLGHELARALTASGYPPPDALLVAGRNGPAEALSHRPVHALPDHALVAALERLGGMPQVVLDQPGLLRAYLPVLRNDLRIVETYRYRPAAPAGFPISVFGGRRDPLTDPSALLGWSRETTAAFTLTLLPAGHFFLDREDFLAALTAALPWRDDATAAEPAAAAGVGDPAAVQVAGELVLSAPR